MQNNNQTHWPSILILIDLAVSALFLFGLALVMGVSSLVNLVQGMGDAAGNMISMLASFFELALVVVSGRFILQKTLHKPEADAPAHFPVAVWQFYFLPIIILVAILIGARVTFYNNQWLSWVFLPALTLIAVTAPILLFFGIGSRGIELGPRWRVWSTLGIGLTLGPLAAFLLEALAMLVIGGVVFVILSLQSDKANEFRQIVSQIQLAKSQDVILQILAPYIVNPLVLSASFGLLSVIVPFIEELFKPLAVWLFARHIEKPSQGFALGTLSGAAFAVIESLNVSGDSSMSWPMIVGVRAATSLLHITTAGLMGFAIVSAFRAKKFKRLILTLLAVMSIHGIWNTCAASVTLASLGNLVGRPEWFAHYLPAIIGGLIALAIGMFVVLLRANYWIRASISTTEEGVQ